MDLYGKYKLADLLRDLNAIPELKWIRVLYCYPDSFTDDLVKAFTECEKVCKYVDLPLQHASNSLLKTMRRFDTREDAEKLLAKLRKAIPNLCVRSTFIVGFPGETQEQFNELKDFMEKAKFNCAGVFTYSQEEGTEAGAMTNQIPEDVKQERYHELMSVQALISEENEKAREGSIVEAVVEGFDSEDPTIAIGRSTWEAPDIDGKIYIENGTGLKIGSFIKVKISRVSHTKQ